MASLETCITPPGFLGRKDPADEYVSTRLTVQNQCGPMVWPLERISSGTGNDVHMEAQGSVTSVTAANGGVAAYFRYASYGGMAVALDSTGDRYRYVGQALDPTSGLDALGARVYDPFTGRFLSTDCKGLRKCGWQLLRSHESL